MFDLNYLGRNRRHTGAAGVLAATMLLLGSSPAAAQFGDAAVVCVGSELETLDSSNPVRRVITEDVAVIYRVGVGAEDREGMERSLLAELGDHAEVSCLWSNPGDSHMAIVRYTGAIRGDLTLDPEDPRFQGFGVGYGRIAEAAEENATTVNARFATYYDGSGYEVLVAETWAVGTGDVPGAAHTAGEPSPIPANAPQVAATAPVSPEETCAEAVTASACWMEAANQPGCYLWSPRSFDRDRGTWSGECAGGYAQGTGTIVWRGGSVIDETGTHIDGIRQGRWILRYNSDGTVTEGTYVDGEKNGRWLVCHYAGDDILAYTGWYVDGQDEDTEYLAHRDPDVMARCVTLMRRQDDI
ncbi:hypothetical protein [Candidatus Palauibacter sp.]|uniref:hypothetical protein n=1 Tax=Candidatus Palauibacter sp. TaxID=3101350 RepID=UPI003B58C9CB